MQTEPSPSQKESKPLCVVCKEQESKYRCPKCGAPYCSVACFKVHKTQCTAPTESNTAGQSTQKESGEDASDVDSDENSDLLGNLISKERLQRIKESESIKELLNEPFLQRAIVKIMESDNKEKALMDLRENSEMAILIDELLLCVGVARRRSDGSVEFIGV
ncbi:hypothetical protein WA577_002583 [Blastocystis sp. JDR]